MAFKKPCSMETLGSLLPSGEGVAGLREWVGQLRAAIVQWSPTEVTGLGYFTLDKSGLKFKAKVAFYEDIRAAKPAKDRDEVVGAMAQAFREGHDAIAIEGIGTFFTIPRPTGDGVFVKLRDDSFQAQTIAELEAQILDDDAFCTNGEKLRHMNSTASVDRLAAALGAHSPAQRARAAEALGYMAPMSAPAIDALIAVVDDSSAQVCASAVFTLGVLKAKTAADAIAGVIDHKNALCRERAAEALYAIGVKGAGPKLLARFKRERELAVRVAIVKALGKVGDHAALSVILSALRDPDEELQSAALVALRAMGRTSGAAVKAIKELIAKNEAEITDVIEKFGGKSNLDDFGAELVGALQQQNKLARKALPR
jgi:hypothetical protein